MFNILICMLLCNIPSPYENQEEDFPFYNDIVCLNLSEDIHITAERGSFSIYYKTKILRCSDFEKKGLSIPDSIPSWVTRNRTDDLILYSEIHKNSYSFNGRQFILIENQKFGNKNTHTFNSLLPNEDITITEEDVESLVPVGMEWQDYFIADLNNDGLSDLVVYFSEVDGDDGQQLGYVEIFQSCNSGYCRVQTLPAINTDVLHLSYLTFKGHPPVIFVGGESHKNNKTQSNYYFFIVNESLSKEPADLSNCESFIKQEPYQLIKD